MHLPRLLSAPLLFLLPLPLLAATYTVGPSGRDYTQLSALVDDVDLEPGDVVLVDGDATYGGDIIVRSSDRGAPGNPVTFRWARPGRSCRAVPTPSSSSSPTTWCSRASMSAAVNRRACSAKPTT